ncbi:glycosyltransferase family 2 protein [Sodalis sp. dw_96]|uniref:glycosyltransferase family 2 protein n=1 Tax=Sodalis sp. dw_96 TaxID=2719794 RepID=UPI001BD43BF0|nr:glycosyltransferase family 2 protein [Sodalis sp. dw_96]
MRERPLSSNVPLVLTIVVPCYNEEEVFPDCLLRLRQVLSQLRENGKISERSCLLFVDDGSRDQTWQLISAAHRRYDDVHGLKLSRNRGHQRALWAGLEHADSDITVSIDADLQDDIQVIGKMVDAYLSGKDIVYGVRENRDTDTVFKRNTALCFYKLMKILGVNQIENHADFRLLSARALKSLLSYTEENIYIRGLVPLVGFQTEQVFYSRGSRLAGESKYPLRKMLGLALEGITSLSITPLRIIAFTGFAISLLSFLTAIYALAEKILGSTVEGWTSVMIAIFFLGGIQMLSIGIIGEYIGKVYLEVKHRPKYIVDEYLQ